MREEIRDSDIAIIGMSGRFPGAKDIGEFWKNLQGGIESITFFTDEELVLAGVSPSTLRDPNYVKARGVIEDIEMFDASFFGYSPKEATVIDPQQRIFLEHAWTAIESAGYNPEDFDGRIGVYAGSDMNSYLTFNILTHYDLLSERSGDRFQILIGNDKDFLATRVSYKLNLRGPSFSVQTACSTSLVAIHLACQSLLNGECDMALAGGVSVSVPQKEGYLFIHGGMVSPDGHCRAFDTKARGSVFGSGVGIVVLKLLTDAVTDGDYIYAVIKGSAINNDGALKAGYTAPSINGQARAIAEALAIAEVPAEAISYIETHGTATPLGDPIEIAALKHVFQSQTNKKGFCAIGSVKTNVGHLSTASGVAGLIKTVLALKYSMLPPSLHFEQQNPEIDFANSPFFVNTQLIPWKGGDTPRRAGVSSFGLGGTNAHVILEEAPNLPSSATTRSWQLLLLSAKTATALTTVTDNLRDYLQEHEETNLADVSYTLNVGRKRWENRRMVVYRTREEAIQVLNGLDNGQVFGLTCQHMDRPVAFLFPGLGEQYAGMAYALYQEETIFRKWVDYCCACLQSHFGRNPKEILFPTGLTEDITALRQKKNSSEFGLRVLLGSSVSDSPIAFEAIELLRDTLLAQPAVFIIEYALAQQFLYWGVQPKAMIGYSLGEYVAACLSGVIALEDVLRLVARRAEMIQELPLGAMIAVALSEEAVAPYLNDQLDLAAVNGSMSCVLGGPSRDVEQLERTLRSQKIASLRVETTHAFHTRMLEPLQERLTSLVRDIELHAPQIPYVSNVTGTWITEDQATDPSYWALHMCRPVRFARGLDQLLQGAEYILLEVGPGQSWGGFVRQHPSWRTEHLPLVVPTLSSISDICPDQASVLTALGRVWLAGAAVNWTNFYADEQRGRLPLPTYPFERQSYWIEPRPATTLHSQHLTEEEQATGGASDLSSYRRPDVSNVAYVGPRTEIERKLAAIWCKVLSIDAVSIDDNFFELGGHSLLATQIVLYVYDAFQVELPLRAVMQTPTIASMAVEIVQRQAAKTEDEMLTRALAELESLSEEEVQRILTDENQRGGQHE